MRRPGRETRSRPETIGSPSWSYFRPTRSVVRGPSSILRYDAMNPSCSSTFRTSSFRREAGMSTRSWPARIALRSRVNRSLSVSLVFIASPRGLHDAGDVPHVGVLPETDPAQAELAEDAPRPAADAAAPDRPGHELRLLRRLDAHCPSGHLSLEFLCPFELLGEGHAELRQERLRPVVPAGRRHDRDVQALRLVGLRVVDLREDEVVAHAQRVVAPAVERLARHAAEVADAWQRDVDEPVEELPHPVAAQGHPRADRHAGAELVGRDRLLRLGHDGPL